MEEGRIIVARQQAKFVKYLLLISCRKICLGRECSICLHLYLVVGKYMKFFNVKFSTEKYKVPIICYDRLGRD